MTFARPIVERAIQWLGRRRLLLALIAFCIYGLAFFPLHRALGPSAAALAALPVIAAGWLMGFAGGAISAALAALLITVQLNVAGYPGWMAAIEEGGGPGLFALLLLGGTVGHMRDVNHRYQQLLEARERAQEQLRLQAAALQAAANSIVITDRNGNISWVNPAFTRLTGYPAAEVVGRNPRLLQSGRQAAAQYEELWRTILAGDVWSGELINRRKDGSLYIEDQTITPVPDAGGQISHFIAIKQDITERKAAEEQAQRSLRQLHALAAIDRAIISRLTLPAILDVAIEQVASQLGVDALSIFLVNDEHEMLAYAAGRGFHGDIDNLGPLVIGEGLIGQVALEQRIVHIPNLAAAAPSAFDSLMSQENFVSYLGVPLVTDGQLKGVLNIYHRAPLELTPEWRALLDSLALQTAVAIDHATLFAEVDRLLEQSRSRAEQIQLIIDKMPEALLLLDSQDRVVLTNPKARTYLPALIKGRDDAPLTQLGSLPLAQILTPIPDGGKWSEVALPDEGRIFEVAAQPVSGQSGKHSWLLLLREVTEERQRQERQQAQDRLATVGQLAMGIAHDFNNILAIINLYSEILLRNPEHEKGAYYLSTIKQQAQYAGNLIGQLLDFSSRTVMERQTLDLVPFVSEVVKLLRRTLPERVTVELMSQAESLPVLADPTRLQQVLLNLAVNASQAMPTGGRLELRLARLDLTPDRPPPLPGMSSGTWICLTVADSGCGIATDVLPHIFEPFFSTKQPGTGVGLGLSQAYGIIKQHEGTITVESQVGKGTTFNVFLPYHANGSGAIEPRVEPSDEAASDGKTILLVEDGEATRAAIGDALEMLGYRVLVATSGVEAVAMFARHQVAIDLVITDMVMPGMDGRQLCLALKERDPGVKILLMSGYPPDMDEREFQAQGIAAWLPKPFTVAALASKIREAMVV